MGVLPTWLRQIRDVRRLHRQSRLGPGNRHDALQSEVDFWRSYLVSRGGEWPDGYAFRFDPTAEVNDPVLRDLLVSAADADVAILDVGAGPATTIGQHFPGKQLHIVAVDPLAAEYDRLLSEVGLDPPVRTQAVAGEQLAQHFAPASFDIAYARNAIDHSVEPLRIVQEMLEVVRPGGRVVLRHARNEGITERYGQLHQWNFDVRRGRFRVWRHGGPDLDVAAHLDGVARLDCHIERSDYAWVVCVIEKAEREQRTGSRHRLVPLPHRVRAEDKRHRRVR